MRTDTISITLTPPGFLERAWYRRLGSRPPGLTGASGPRSASLARMLPYSWRWWHRAYAARFGYFWLPCPLCSRKFGGHEFGTDIPDPLKGPGCGLAICSRCTRARNEQLAVLNGAP
jgi:hypothetical protein